MSAVYITPERYASIGTLPISLVETELRRGSSVHIATFKLHQAEEAHIRVLNLAIVRILTPGSTPDNINSTFGYATVGVYGPINLIYGYMLCSPIISVSARGIGTVSLNSYADHAITTPGTYVVAAFNNTGLLPQYAIDMTVCVTGVIKFYT